MALVGQEPTLFNLSVRENIAYGLDREEATPDAIISAAKLANVHSFIESLPLVCSCSAKKLLKNSKKLLKNYQINFFKFKNFPIQVL
jgi:ABC-type multidrug transport system fused ATPase/permease subunit